RASRFESSAAAESERLQDSTCHQRDRTRASPSAGGDMNASVGAAITRTDGPAKVAGQALYAGDFEAPRLAYAVLVQSTIPKGRIVHIDHARAAAAPGVLLVM